MTGIDFDHFFEKYKYRAPVALGLVGIVLIAGGLFASNSTKSSNQAPFPKESLVSAQKKIVVDVSGAVKNPGVYEIEVGARVEQAIAVAGGLDERVNQQYISKSLNLAQSLSDGMKIYVPFEGEQTGGISGSVAGASAQTGKVNLNTGTQVELEALPGIGPVTASKIISGRPYGKVSDLLDQKIVSKAVYEKIKDSIILY